MRSKPTISSVTKTGNTYSVTVVPDTSAGFASYPPGGWTAIEVVAELYVDEFTDFPECKCVPNPIERKQQWRPLVG